MKNDKNIQIRSVALKLLCVGLWVGIACSGCSSKPQEPIPQEQIDPKMSVRSKTTSSASNVPVPMEIPAPSGVNSITQAAVRAGVLSCTSRVDQLASFLTANSQSGAYLFTVKQQPDRHVFSTSLEVKLPNNTPVMYATASFLPLSAGGCDAVYDTVEYTEQSCAQVSAQYFKGGATGVIRQEIQIYDAGTVKFFLMPAGQGCVVIKKETVLGPLI